MIEPRCYLHRARLVVPMAADQDSPSFLVDGAVLTEDGRIVKIDVYDKLRSNEATLVDHGDKILLPAMVNCHTHLELSWLASLGQKSRHNGDITQWISQLLAEREKPVDPEEERMTSWQALAHLYASGCRAIVDIGNNPDSAGIGENFKVEVRFFRELLGLSSAAERVGREILDRAEPAEDFTGHAPYSTGAALLKLLKKRARDRKALFPIHLAESPAEVEFLRDGSGPMRTFLEQRGVWDGSFSIPGLSPVAYLDSLGLLDSHTLAVHCVQVDDDDIVLLARSGVTVCLCPGSNRFLGVGKAPVPALLEAGVPMVLGTDSLASNPRLDLWEEMRLLAIDHPILSPLDILRMATVNGAVLMGLEKETGMLAPGCSSSFLAVSTGFDANASPEELLTGLVGSGRPQSLEWVE